MTEQQQENTQTETGISSWLEVLPEEMRKEPSLGKFKDIAALAQSYLEAEKSLGKRVAIPQPESSDDEWLKFYQKMGLPEDRKYTDQRNQEDEEYLKAYEEMFYQNGLTKRQGERLLKSMYEYSGTLQKKQQEELEKAIGNNIDWLRNSYSDAFDSKMSLMQAALQKFGSKELAALVEESHYAPSLIDFLVKVGGTLQSDSLVTGSEKPAASDAATALKEIKRLESDSDFMIKLHGKNHPAHAEAVRQMEELYKIAYSKLA